MNVNFDLSHPGSEIMDDIIVLTTCIVLMNLGIITFRNAESIECLLYYYITTLYDYKVLTLLVWEGMNFLFGNHYTYHHLHE